MWVDLHNHVIPGVDDGAATPAEAVAALEAFAAEGVEVVVATPHLDGSLTTEPELLAQRLDELDRGWGRLQEAVEADGAGEAEGVALPGRLERAAEVRLDVPDVDLSDPRLRIAGGRSVLVEFPFMQVPPRAADVIRSIRDAGWQPLLAHPERYRGVDPELRLVREWLEAGVFLQVNAGAVAGRYGSRAQAVARAILAEGLAHCLASDYHASGPVGVRAVRDTLEGWEGAEAARLLFETNPERVLAGEIPLPVPPVREPRSLLRRLGGVFSRGGP